MVQRKNANAGATRRRVWRVSEAAPLGEFVYPDEAPPKPAAESEPIDPGWRMSSFELTHGLEVSETPADTVPGDVFDELFRR
jgi:hypothetical protein